MAERIFKECKNIKSVSTDSEYFVSNFSSVGLKVEDVADCLLDFPISIFKGKNIKLMCLVHLNNLEKDIPSDVKDIVSHKTKEYLPDLFKANNVGAIIRALDTFELKLPTITACTEVAKTLGNPEIDALLLEKSNKFTIEDKQKESFKKLNKNPYSVAEMKKIWKYEKDKDGNITILKYKGSDPDVIIPSMIGKNVVTGIGAEGVSSFLNNTRSIELSNSINYLHEDAFVGCSYLTEFRVK